MPRLAKKPRKGQPLARDIVEAIVKTAKKPIKAEERFNARLFVPTGSTLLNLALSDRWNGGFMLGKMVNVIGDKGTGKSFLAHSVLAEAAHKGRFAEYELDHDDVEAAIEYNIPYLFGKKLEYRLTRLRSKTIRDFSVAIWNRIKKSQPFIYALDCFDALTSDEELKRMSKEANKKKGTQGKGSYKTEKVRGFSEMLRLMIQGIYDANSLLIIISQVRENLTAMPFQPRFRRTGGKALDHNETHELWLATVGKLRKTKGGPPIGVMCKVNITKNRITGKSRSVEFPIYYDYGIDDVGSIIDWLVSENSDRYWKKKNGVILAGELGHAAKRSELIRTIEKECQEKELRLIAQKAWDKVEEKLRLHRKRRYPLQ